jgi:hypothetical protein
MNDEQTKKKLGQFYTTNCEYILTGMDMDPSIVVIEPFTGTGELVDYSIKKFGVSKFDLYDIDPKYTNINVVKLDTLLHPPSFSNKFVLTNPPYLARNKNKDKVLYDKYDVNDLYKCFIKIMTINCCVGGIIIVPLNFWCSIRNSDKLLRKEFLKIYKVLRVNVFEENVFDDTSYSVCSFSFEKRDFFPETVKIPFYFFPSKTKINIDFSLSDCVIGSEIYEKTVSGYKVDRSVSGIPNTNILVSALDSGCFNGKRINLSLSYDKISTKHSDRTFATLNIYPEITLETQKYVIEKFNEYIEGQRTKYNSLFLSNYRESKDYPRKRISFGLVYSIVTKILNDYDN